MRMLFLFLWIVINQNPPTALNGYDPVAYFTVSDTVRGLPGIFFDHNGSRWHFSSQENKDRFSADTEKYSPQYDGTCAYAASENYVAPADPIAWSIVDGRLYLNYNLKVREIWNKNREERIQSGDANWPELKKKIR